MTGPNVAQGGDPEDPPGPPPPAAGDLLSALRAYGYPAVEVEGRGVIAGEDAWRAAIAAASSEDRVALWAALQAVELERP